MFTNSVIASTAAVAQRHGVEPAVLLAVVEIESAGKAFEADGRTPRFLFERHVFHRELKRRAPEKLDRAVREGLAVPRWSRATQYRDQATSAGRMSVLIRARAIDQECANRSASWGVGQTMGFNAPTLGFASATAMVDHMRVNGLAGQIEVMRRTVTDMNLWGALKAKDFAAFARRYNGAGYKQNKYDTRMAAACARWEKRLANGIPRAVDPEPRPAMSTRTKEIGTLVAASGGAAAAAQGAGGSMGAIVAAGVVVAVAMVAAILVFRARTRKQAELPVIPAFAR